MNIAEKLQILAVPAIALVVWVGSGSAFYQAMMEKGHGKVRSTVEGVVLGLVIGVIALAASAWFLMPDAHSPEDTDNGSATAPAAGTSAQRAVDISAETFFSRFNQNTAAYGVPVTGKYHHQSYAETDGYSLKFGNQGGLLLTTGKATPHFTGVMLMTQSDGTTAAGLRTVNLTASAIAATLGDGETARARAHQISVDLLKNITDNDYRISENGLVYSVMEDKAGVVTLFIKRG